MPKSNCCDAEISEYGRCRKCHGDVGLDIPTSTTSTDDRYKPTRVTHPGFRTGMDKAKAGSDYSADPTPQPQCAEEIEAIIEGIFLDGYVAGKDGDSSFPSEKDYARRTRAIQALITEARIHELNIIYIGNYSSNPYKTDRYIKDRLAELQASKEDDAA